MNILCVSATELEIAPFLAVKPTVDFLLTGVGAPMTIYQLTKRLQQIDYDMVIQAGIAGSFTNALALGEVVLVQQDCFSDLGISEKGFFSTLFEKGFAKENDFPFTKGHLENNGLTNDFGYKKVNGITVNTITDEVVKINQQKQQFDPVLESMEGAALHYVCLMEKMPFLQIRSISNYVGERDKTKWKMKEAIDNLNISLVKIIQQLSNGVSSAIKP